MLSVEAVDEGGTLPDLDVGAPKAPTPVSIHTHPFYDRAKMGAGDTINGPAIILDPTGTDVMEAGWSATVDALGNLVLTFTDAARKPQASTDADPVLLEVMSNLFKSVADQMGVTLSKTSQSVNIKERFDFSCVIFDGAGDLVANTRMTDPEILEKRFPVRLDWFEVRDGSGCVGRQSGGNDVRRVMTFLEPVTVTTLCSHRIVPPFGVDGGGAGALGRNWAVMPDGTRHDLNGNNEIDLPHGGSFVMETPGGGGWGKP